MAVATTSRGWRTRIAAATAVLMLAAVPMAATTVAPPAHANAEVCGGYHGPLISAGGCGNGYAPYEPYAYGPPPPTPPPPPPAPVDVCGGYHGPRVTVGGCA